MKVLYVGAFRDGSGWSAAALDTLFALDAVGVDVVPRCIRLSQSNPPMPERYLHLESKDPRGADIVIQNILPFMMDYNGNFKRNIAYYFIETSNFISSNWAEFINTLDEAWVPCAMNHASSIDSGVRVPIRVMPCACDIEKYAKHYNPLPLRDQLKDSFIFYLIGEGTRRKNIAAVVKAFHLEFDPSEPVELLIKTSMPGIKPDAVKARMIHDSQIIKEGLNLYSDPRHYKREMFLTERMSDEGIMRLHATGDCFVLPSYGEGWGVPIFDAMAMGKTPITTNWGAVKEYMSNGTGWLVPGHMEPVFGMQSVHGNLYTGHQDWCLVDVRGLQRAMREAYENSSLRMTKSLNGFDRACDFSYETVGKTMKRRLEKFSNG